MNGTELVAVAAEKIGSRTSQHILSNPYKHLPFWGRKQGVW